MPLQETLHWSTLPPMPPTADALRLLRDAWRGVKIDAHEGTLVAFNVAGYAAGLAVNKEVGPVPMFASPSPAVKRSAPDELASPEEIEAAFAQCCPEPERGVMRETSVAALPWNILLPVALDLLRRWLKI